MQTSTGSTKQASKSKGKGKGKARALSVPPVASVSVSAESTSSSSDSSEEESIPGQEQQLLYIGQPHSARSHTFISDLARSFLAELAPEDRALLIPGIKTVIASFDSSNEFVAQPSGRLLLPADNAGHAVSTQSVFLLPSL